MSNSRGNEKIDYHEVVKEIELLIVEESKCVKEASLEVAKKWGDARLMERFRQHYYRKSKRPKENKAKNWREDQLLTPDQEETLIITLLFLSYNDYNPKGQFTLLLIEKLFGIKASYSWLNKFRKRNREKLNKKLEDGKIFDELSPIGEQVRKAFIDLHNEGVLNLRMDIFNFGAKPISQSGKGRGGMMGKEDILKRKREEAEKEEKEMSAKKRKLRGRKQQAVLH